MVDAWAPDVSWKPVRVRPGHSAVTFTPGPRTSSCTASVKLLTNAFVAEYVALKGPGWNPPIDDPLTSPPRLRSTMPASPARVARGAGGDEGGVPGGGEVGGGLGPGANGGGGDGGGGATVHGGERYVRADLTPC